MNLYAYVFNNPVGRVDPLGLCVVNSSGGGFSNGIISPNAIPNLMLASTGYNAVDAYRLLHEGYRMPSVDIPWGQYGQNILSGLGWLADTTLRPVSDIVAGFGDTITLGGTRWIRSQWNQAFGWSDSVDYGSAGYNVGRWGGYAWAIATGAIAVEAGAAAIVGAAAITSTAASNAYVRAMAALSTQKGKDFLKNASDFASGFFDTTSPEPNKWGLRGVAAREFISRVFE